MVTAEEIGEIGLFAGLDASARERLSRAAADISLVPGEYAAPQGGERALFAVLEGRIEPVQQIDGIERVVGVRNPGEIFGEVPIVLGTVFPVGFRAAEPSRVMRLEARDYHEIAAVVPEVAAAVGKLASHRMSGARGCRASRPSRARHGRSSSVTAGTATPRTCAASSTATRSRSSGSRPTRRTPSSAGAGRCPPTRTCRPSASSTARPSSGRACAGSPSC